MTCSPCDPTFARFCYYRPCCYSVAAPRHPPRRRSFIGSTRSPLRFLLRGGRCLRLSAVSGFEAYEPSLPPLQVANRTESARLVAFRAGRGVYFVTFVHFGAVGEHRMVPHAEESGGRLHRARDPRSSLHFLHLFRFTRAKATHRAKPAIHAGDLRAGRFPARLLPPMTFPHRPTAPNAIRMLRGGMR